MILSKIQEQIINGKDEIIRIPRVKGATYAIIEGAFQHKKAGETVLVIGDSIFGFSNILNEKDMPGWDIKYTNSKNMIILIYSEGEMTAPYKIIFTYEKKIIKNTNNIYCFVYIDNVSLTEDELSLLPCISHEYCVVQEYDFETDIKDNTTKKEYTNYDFIRDSRYLVWWELDPSGIETISDVLDKNEPFFKDSKYKSIDFMTDMIKVWNKLSPEVEYAVLRLFSKQISVQKFRSVIDKISSR